MLFVSIAFPVAENLDKVIRNTSPCSRSGCPISETVTWKMSGKTSIEKNSS